MSFDSAVFLKFFIAFLLLYWLVQRNLKARNLLIVAASYLFYGWWDYRFLALILVSSLLDYVVGLGLERALLPRQRRLWLWVSLAGNFGILGFFKYFDFFVESFRSLLAAMGLPFHVRTLDIILPVGISFYTFQSLSYALDVYRGRIPATRNLVNFLAYVSFFPQLVAGPIERAQHLLPQFARTLRVTRAMLEEGAWLILWGLFKKVALADNFAPLVEMVYHGPAASAPAVALGTLAFGLQIYCDFSGYSDIARGTAKWLGFDIMVNFNLPYAATNLRDFWRRWHISLSTWLRDYLYVTLGGNRHGQARTYRNLFLTMLLGGLWHGAAWNFALWGAWHGLGLALQRWFGRAPAGERSSTLARPFPPAAPLHHAGSGDGSSPPDYLGRAVPAPAPAQRGASASHAHDSKFGRIGPILSWGATMLFVFYGWLLFRAGSMEKIISLTRGLGDFSFPPWLPGFTVNLAAFATPLLLMEIWEAKSGNPLVALNLSPAPRAALQGALLVGILLFWDRTHVPFIYFQF